MRYGDESDKQNSKFHEVALPPGALDDPNNQLLDVTRASPTADPASASPRGPARRVGPSTGVQAWNRTLRPRHRGVIRRYFDSPPRGRKN